VAIGKLIKITQPTYKKPESMNTGEQVTQLKFSYGKKQKVDEVDLDALFTDLQSTLQKHPLVPAANIDALVSEWINDLLFLAGKITEEELQEAMKSFESQGVEPTTEAGAAADGEDDGDDDE
jgi:hypothetical protein